MYPLNVTLPAPAIGFAVANDEDEHERLTAAGYMPALVKKPAALLPAANAEGDADQTDEAEAVRAKLRELGIKFHPNTGLEKLKALLPAP